SNERLTPSSAYLLPPYRFRRFTTARRGSGWGGSVGASGTSNPVSVEAVRVASLGIEAVLSAAQVVSLGDGVAEPDPHRLPEPALTREVLVAEFERRSGQLEVMTVLC